MSFTPYFFPAIPGRGLATGKYFLRTVLFTFIMLAALYVRSQSYTVSQSGTYNIEINNPLTISLLENTIYAVPIGFNFTFFGNSYSTCYVSQNGFVTFNAGGAGGAGQQLPDQVTPNNLIAAAWTDQDTAIVRYEVLGSTPNRRLIITLTMQDPCGADYYGQVKLFETTNVIEIHTQQWASANSPCTTTTQGIENAFGRVAIQVPGRNSNTTWSVDNGDNDFVSFTPHEVYIVENPTNFDMEFDNETQITITEDGLAEIPIGFNFNFFGRTYSNCTIGNNGILAFGAISDGGCCEGQLIPDPSGPNNLIAAAWMEVYQYNCCQQGNYYNFYWYETMGTAPNRRLLVYYEIEDVYCGAYFEGQIKLFEGSDIIEIHTNLFADGVVPCEPVTQGIENADGTQAYFIEGRNANNDWSVPCCEEVVRFTPASSFPDHDAGVSAIDDDPFCEGSPMMSASLRNYGGQEIDSVQVQWKWNGVAQTPVMAQTNMPVGNQNYQVNLGTKPIVFGQTYTLKAWTSMPNGYTDERVSNDTMTSSIKAGLHGSFTIGGSSPSYATFAAAITALETNGICDTVIFNVRPGTYITQVKIPHIEGAYGNHKIIFQAENGDSTSVIVQFTSTVSTSNYVLRLDGAHNVIWQKMTMKALGTSNARVIELLNTSFGNVIRHCAMEGRNSTVSSNSYACVYSNSYNHDNTFFKNTFRYGSYSFYHSDASRPPGIIFSDNKCIDFNFNGFYAFEPSAIQIHRNVFESTKSMAGGIYINLEEDSLSISNNKINLTLGLHGIRLNGCNQYGGPEKLILFNNLINVLGPNCLAGLELNNSENVEVVHNTVNISLSASTGFAFLESSGERDTIYNNIFSNKGNGLVISTSSSDLMDFDYNNLYTTGSALGSFDGILTDNLNEWRSVSGFDVHSLNVNPLFTSLVDLHAANSFLNGAGSPDHTVTYDYDQQVRNAIAPDIGADEFTTGADDAAITSVISPVVSCNALQDIIIVLTNLGSDTLESVTIKWKLNGIAQTDHVYNLPLLPEGDTAHVLLASLTFSGTPDILRFWSSMPNGDVDAQLTNDTLDFRFRLPLTGNYTIGGTSPDFLTFKSAVDDLNRFHTCGPVTFKFRNGIYAEQVRIDSIPTASEVNTITFESQSLDSSLVTLQWTVVNAGKTYNILLNGTDFITFRHLGFKSLSTTNANILEAINGVTHLTLSNNKLEGTLTNVAYANNHLYKATSGKQEYITFANNYFLGSTNAINVINTIGSGNLTPRDYYFTGNSFVNQKAKAINMVNCDGLYIRDNNISCTTNLPYQGIEINSISGYSEVSGNEVVCVNNGSGLFINFINYSRPGSTHIFNNMVRSASNGHALSLWNTHNLHVNFNNAYASGTGVAIEIGGGDTMQIRNNIFAANSNAVYSGQSTPATITCDFNDVYSASGVIGYWNGTYPTMSAWQSGTAFDANSLNVDPEFISSTDLHVYADTLDMAGIPVAGIIEDIDEQERDALVPDIGADEIGTEENDAGIRDVLPEMPFVRGLQYVKAVIRNFGSDTLMTATIKWKLNGVQQPDFFYAGPLPSLAQDTVILGQPNFALNTAYQLTLWTTSPNQSSDGDVTNDTLINAPIYAAVSGDVVVGTAGDVSTISNAISAMNVGGLIGTVRFLIKSGTYHESINLISKPYLTCTAPITFEAITGNKADVIWDNVGTGTHTILLDGVDGIHFKNLTINTALTNFQAVRMINGATCNIVEDCALDGITTTSSSTANAVIFGFSNTTTDYNDNTIIRNNIITDGGHSIYWDGNNGTIGLKIENNTLTNARNAGAFVFEALAPMIRGNTVSSNTTLTSYSGIHAEGCDNNLLITANQILMHGKSGRGINLKDGIGTASLPALVANNFVIIGGSVISYGLYVDNCTYVQAIHNTLRLSGGVNTSININRQNGANTTFLNNILDNRTNGRPLVIVGTGVFSSDYNSFYKTGTNLVTVISTNYATLAAWQATGKDLNSIFEQPDYDIDTPLGFRIIDAAMDGQALPQASVSTDIDGLPRDPVMPDMGCDEYNLFTHDVGLISISYPYQPFPEGMNTVFVKFINNGEDTLTSMQVHWAVDDIVQPLYQWNGLLPSAGTYDSLDIGEFNFEAGIYHDIKVWVDQPNGVQDQLASNDTLAIDSLYPALSGVYTIGGNEPDFETITDAVSELNKGGVYESVHFNLRPGTYLDTIHLRDYPGSDCNAEVIFQSESGNAEDVLITNLGLDAHTIVLDGADGVTFQYLSMTSVNPAYSHVIVYSGGAHCNRFQDNVITGYVTTTTNLSAAVIYSPTGLDTANVFTRNQIHNGSYSFYVLGNSSALSNTIIDGNSLIHPHYRGIYANLEYGIRADSNQIDIVDGSVRGIDFTDCQRAKSVSNNNIRIASGFYGIIFTNSDGLSNAPVIIANNFISIGGTSTARGIYLNLSDYNQILSNNIHVFSTNSSLSFTTPIYLLSSASVAVINNALVNDGAGYAIYSNNITSLSANRNSYYTSGSNLGYWNGLNQQTLANWQAASTQDPNSLNLNPQFMSNTDLHVSNILLNGVGQYDARILRDYDSDIRSNPPDIGADEFDPSLANDAGAFMVIGPIIPFAHGNQPVTIAVKNFGADPLTSADVRWVINGIEQPVYHWTGSLPPAQCDTVVIGNYSFAAHTKHDMTFWTEAPNYEQDSVHLNDTLTVTDLYPALSGSYTVGGFAPDFNLISTLTTSLNIGGVIGNVTFNFRPGTYDSPWSIIDFPRSSYNHIVTFQSEDLDSSAVTLTQNVNNTSLIDLNDAHRITFRHLTLLNRKYHVINIRSGSSDIKIEHNNLHGSESLSSSNSLVYSPSTNEDSISILNNLFTEGYYSIYLYGDNYEKAHVISGNTFTGSIYTCIYAREVDGITITGNKCLASSTSSSDVLINYTTGKLTFTNNRVISDNSANAVDLYSIVNATGNASVFANNYIYKSGAGAGYGVIAQTSSNINFYFNSIYNALSNSASTAFYSYWLTAYNIKNNIFYSTLGLAFHNATGTPTANDYNTIFSRGPVQINYNGITYGTLVEFALNTNTNTHSVAADPLFQSTVQPLIAQYQLNASGVNVTGITTDYFGVTRTSPPDMGAAEFTPLSHDLKVALVQSPVDGCGLSNNEPVTVTIVNQGSLNESNITIKMNYDGNVITENTGASVIVAGDSLTYTFETEIDASAFETKSIIAWIELATDLKRANDTIVHIFTNHPPFDNPVNNMIPLNGTSGLENQVSLSWLPANGAVSYNLYLWPSSGSKPLVPTVTGIQTINKLVTNLLYGQQYLWQIHAVNICSEQLASDTSSFFTRYLPDLTTESIDAPLTGFSEQAISVEWVTHNVGQGNTVPGTWYDNVYLSSDPTYNSFDVLLGSFSNLNSLTTGMSYAQSAIVILPEGTNGMHYIIVKTDHYSTIKESIETNNYSYSAQQINVILSPPPDLIVTEITTPALTFSGQDMNIAFKVKNIGSGITGDSIWKDEITLVPAPGNQTGVSTTLLTKTHTGLLSPNQEYLVNQVVHIPANIFGNYRIKVWTDERNDVYEFASNGNNQLESNTFEIVLTPPVDLVPDSLALTDTISLYQASSFSYQVNNEGGSSPLVSWTDRYYLSQSPVYNPNFLIHLGYVYHAAGLMPGQSSHKTVNLTLTGNYVGTYYLYIVSDYNNKINEFSFEGNNTIRSSAIQIIRPDLIIDTLEHPAAALAGYPIVVNTKMINLGPGVFSGTVNNRYYLSTDPVINTMSDVLLTSKNFTGISMDVGDTVARSFTLSTPPSLYGSLYIIGHTDAALSIHEGNNNNNTYASPITLYEAPHVDIIALNLLSPGNVTAGVPFQISYDLKNAGDVPMLTSQADSIFISFSPTWNRTSAQFMVARTTNVLDTNETRPYLVELNTTFNQNPNIYYIYIVSDARHNHYEGSGETNNIIRSNAITLNAYPEIDLKTQLITGISDTIVSGQLLNIHYHTLNLSSFNTYFSSWTDRCYLSVDSIFNSGSDMAIASLPYTIGKINGGADQWVHSSLQIPHGITGDYYIFIETDWEDQNQDPNRANNIELCRTGSSAKKIHIRLALYPDLKATNFVAPVSVYAGQHFNIITTFKNDGPGVAGSRVDRYFVSTNELIETGDLQLAGINKGTLNAGQSKSDTIDVFIPANYSGNYYLIGSLDHLEQVYEYQWENNNKVISTITVLVPPPSDLLVQNILVPDSVLAGENAMISWQTKNQGANPASGIFREIIYLSADTTWNLNDEVLGVWDGPVALTPGGVVTKSITLPYNNVTNGDYHTIIRTDARNNFLESNENNNDGFSFDQTNLDIEEIFLESHKYDTLSPNVNRYFKLNISGEEAGYNIKVDLTGDSLTGVNQMFIKYGAVPTPADHDYSYSKPFSPDQSIIIRNAQPGYYYVLVQGFMFGNDSDQEILIYPRLIRMEIVDVTPARGSNNGFTTLEITGSELDSIVKVKLVLDDTLMYFEVVADTFMMMDEGSRVMARFNLQNIPVGHYHVQCLRESIYLASKPRGYEAFEGDPGELSLQWTFNPKSYNARFNSIFQIKIDVENTGDSDVEEKQILVGSPESDNPVYYSLQDYYNQIAYGQLVLVAEDQNGFEGILRPGSRRTYYVYGRVEGLQGFTINYDK